ncbi:unnamed protein product [Ascophyllum nodosum]
MQQLEPQRNEPVEISSACIICGERDAVDDTEGVVSLSEESFTLRCNSCRRWYHPWCIGYQLDLDRSCMITSSEIDVPIDPATALPLVCQWFCDSCASTETGVVAATAKKSVGVRVKSTGRNSKHGAKKARKKSKDKQPRHQQHH